jgi:hypothetical protein
VTVVMSSRDAVHVLVEKATDLGQVTGLIHAAGVSPSQASPSTILNVDLYGTALVLEEFGNVVAPGGAGVVIASQSGHRLPPLTVEQNDALATTPVEELLDLPFLQPDQVTDPLHAYQLSKRGNSLRVMAEAVRWGFCGGSRGPGPPTRGAASATYRRGDPLVWGEGHKESRRLLPRSPRTRVTDQRTFFANLCRASVSRSAGVSIARLSP